MKLLILNLIHRLQVYKEKKLFLVYVLGFLVLWTSISNPDYRPRYKKPIFKSQLKKISKTYKKSSNAKLLYAFVTGNKKGVPKKIKNNFKTLGLLHLFTPSGIHLSALSFLFLPFLKKPKARLPVLGSLMFFFYFFTDFHSIKRILLLRTIREWLKKVSLFNIFLLAFLWDLIIGTYAISPLSFSYSFIFLGTILTFIDRPKIYIPFALFGAQIVSQFFFGGSITTTGFIWNFLLTGIFGLIYPFLFCFFIFPSFPYAEEIISLFSTLVGFFKNLSLYLGTVPITINLVALTLYFSFGGKRGWVIGLVLITSVENIKNSPLRVFNQKSEVRISYVHSEKRKWGHKTWHEDRVCYHRPYPAGFHITCYYE